MDQFLEICSLSKAKTFIKDECRKIAIEEITLDNSLNRICAKSILSSVDLPDFDRSTVDGYAVFAENVFGASSSIPSILTLIGSVDMGENTSKAINSLECMYVPTGGMIPRGATAMVMIEDTELLDNDTILIYKPAKPGDNIIYCGDDVKKEDAVIDVGKRITPYDIGLLAGLGISHIFVFKPLKFTVLSTGDEIVAIKDEPKIGEIRDVNGHALCAWLRSRGAIVVEHKRIKDNFKQLKQAINKALEHSDGILLSGGSSKGERDYTKGVIESFEQGRVFLHGLAIKPGKPTILGKIDNTLIFGLPGHPVSALMVCGQLVEAFIRMSEQRRITEATLPAILTKHIRGASGRDSYQLVNLHKSEDEWLASPLFGTSGMIALLAKASGYVVVPRDSEGFLEGSRVKVHWLREVCVEK